MPFKSEKQRKWMWANDPEMAKKWEKKEKMKQETKVRKLIRKMVREIMDEGGPGSGPQPDDDNPFNREPSDDELADIEKEFEGVQEDFGGQLPKTKKKKFEKVREKQSEVLGYKLTGTSDVKTESKKRDYKAEYKKYGSSKKAKKYRAELNSYNRKRGTYGNGDGKDASHKGGKIAGFEKESVNRGRREKSRLKKEEKLTEKFTMTPPGYSSKEAKTVVDGALKQYSKDLKKLQYRVIKDWMSKAKSGVIDYFDLVRGFQTGDAKRANPYEVDFLMSVLTKDKIIDRFRKYFGGKKGKRIR